jgi:hypothetical protein
VLVTVQRLCSILVPFYYAVFTIHFFFFYSLLLGFRSYVMWPIGVSRQFVQQTECDGRVVITSFRKLDVYWSVHRRRWRRKPTRCYSVFYWTCNRPNMFRAPLCPSSGALDYTADYHMSRLTPWLLMVGRSGAGLLAKFLGWGLSLDT